MLISGYRCKIYDQYLKDWRRERYRTTTRGGGSCWEYLWCNFDKPDILHDDRYTGKNFRERERLKRKKTRWVNRIKRMKPLERNFLLAAVSEFMTIPPAESQKLARVYHRNKKRELPVRIATDGEYGRHRHR